ncbi:unnamed protein product [Cunninghamella echinulata]
MSHNTNNDIIEEQQNVSNSTLNKNSTSYSLEKKGDKIINFEKEFLEHRQAIKESNMEKAIQSFILLQNNSNDNTLYNDYLIEIAHHIDPTQDSGLTRFFQSLPAFIQSSIVETASAYLEKFDYLQAYQVLFDYIQAYPRHAYKYLIHTMKLLILGAQGDDKDKCIHVLVTNLLPRLWKQRIILTNSGCAPNIKSSDGKHYIIIPCNLFEEFLRLGQRYFIDHRKWNDVIKFTCSMMDCCGYEGLAKLDFLSHTNRFQYLKEQRHSLAVIQKYDTVPPPSTTPRDETYSGNNNKIKTPPPSSSPSPASVTTNATSILECNTDPNSLSVMVAFICEYLAATSQFTQFSYDYYRAICVMNDENNNSNNTNEKSCLIPICAIQSSNDLLGDHSSHSMTTSPRLSPSTGNSNDINNINKNNNENTTTSISTVNTISMAASTSSSTTTQNTTSTTKKSNEDINSNSNHSTEYRHHKKIKLDNSFNRTVGNEGLDSNCMEGVDHSLQILSKAGDCLRHLVNLWDWATQTSPGIDWVRLFGDWEKEFKRIIDSYQLPFDIYNAVLLVRSELALSTPSLPGNLSKALKLSQIICDRIELQRRQINDKDQLGENNIPFMFAFRVLYTIGVIYLLVGSLQQSTLEIAIILSVFPIPQDLDDKDFIADEIDCHTAATVFRDHEFGLMHVTQRGMVVRCIKHLIVSLDSKTNKKEGMASIDSAMRWDEKAGSMMVLMQCGWPYWNLRTNFWDKIIQQMKDRRTFRNKSVLEYIYVPEILETLLSLHNSNQVIMDIISPDLLLRSGNRLDHPTGTSPNESPHLTTTKNNNDSDRILPSLSSLPISSSSSTSSPLTSLTGQQLPKVYESTHHPSMSPTWYSPSTQNTNQTNWMSPSFYYSRPSTSVILPPTNNKRLLNEIDDHSTNYVPNNEIIAKYLGHRIKKYSNNRITSLRIKHILQRFLKNMVMKGSEDG